MKRMKKIGMDLLVDIVGGLLIAIGVYNFAVASGFPVAGVSGIAMVFYHFWGIPIGIMTNILNIPIALVCYKLLGRDFFLRSIKTMLISNVMLDVVAPLLPVYEGELILSCICMAVFSGIGYAMIYLRDTSTGGADFVVMAVRKLRPHLSLGRIITIFDFSVVIVGGLLMHGDIDSIIYGLVGTYVMSVVIDKLMFGMDAAKLILVVTDHGEEVAYRINELTERGSTFLKAEGSYTKEEKKVVMCACNPKQLHMVQKAVKEVDSKAFLVTMESSEVKGEGFKPH